MYQFKVIIIDDDIFIHEQLKNKLHTVFPQIIVSATCENALQGIEAIKKYSPDLVFLDIQMPELSGFEMLDHIEHKNFSIIFITSFNQYAIEAIRYSAFDYLLKPVDEHELKKALDRFKKASDDISLQGKMDILLHNLKRANDFNLIIPTRQGEKKIKVQQIIRCEADSNYTHFHLSDKTKFTASKTLKDFEDILSKNEFIRIHKSHIVNKTFMSSVTSDGYAMLKDGSKIEISRRRLTEVKNEMEL